MSNKENDTLRENLQEAIGELEDSYDTFVYALNKYMDGVVELNSNLKRAKSLLDDIIIRVKKYG